MLCMVDGKVTPGGESHSLGGFVVARQDDGTWAVGFPQCMDKDAPMAAEVESEAGNPDHLVLKFGSMTLPWQIDGASHDIPLDSDVHGGKISLDISASGTLASNPDLTVYKDQALVEGKDVSFLLGPANKALPDLEESRIAGLSIAKGSVRISITDGEHPLSGENDAKGEFIFATLQYVEEADVDNDVNTVDDLKAEGLRTLNFLSLRVTGEDDKINIYESRWGDLNPMEYITGTSQKLAGEAIRVMNINSSINGSTKAFMITKESLNEILPVQLTSDISAILLKAPKGMVVTGQLPGFELPVPGKDEGLRFGKSTCSLIMGSSHLGGKKALSIEAELENPGILFGKLGENIGTNKKVGLTFQGRTVIINFHNTLEDLKPLGFSLSNPVISIDFEQKAIDLSGTINFPENTPIPLVNRTVDVSASLSKENLCFSMMTTMEMAAFNDNVRLGMDTLVVGQCEGETYFSCSGHARFSKIPDEINLIPNLKVSTNTELSASLFAQSDGTLHVEIEGQDLMRVNAGPVSTTLEDITLCLDYSPDSGWYASASGATNLNIDASPFKFNLTTRALIDTSGTMMVEIPYDPENPTEIALGDLAVVVEYGQLKLAKNAEGRYELSLDATVTTRLPGEIPMIGGQDLTGRMKANSDGTFLFELTEIPQVRFCNMGVGLTDIKIENRKENGKSLLSFEAGAGVEFKSNFVIPPLRNQTISGSVTVSSDLSAKFALKGMMLGIKDFELGIEEIAIEVVKGRDLAISGTASVAVKYPSSKYFVVGLPAALAGDKEGPDFNLKGTFSMSTSSIYFSASSTATEIPVDVPGVIKGVTVGLKEVGFGITYVGIPLFELTGSVYLPDLKGGGDTGVTPALKRPYDSMLGMTLICNIQDGLVVGFDTEGHPKIKLKPIFEAALYEARLGTWCYGLVPSIDVGGKFKVGEPSAGFGGELNLEGGHLLIMAIPMPFWDTCTARCNYGGFGFGLETEFPRPVLAEATHILEFIRLISKGNITGILEQCGKDGKFNEMFPKFAARQAYVMVPALMTKLIGLPNKLDFLFGKDLVLDAGEIYPRLVPLIDAIANPKDTMAQLVSVIPEKMRTGQFNARIGVGKVNLLSGKMKYRLQAREQVFVERKIPNLPEMLKMVDLVNEAEQQPGANAGMHWKLVDNDKGYLTLQNRLTGKYLTLDKRGTRAKSGCNVVQGEFDENDTAFQWIKGAEKNGLINIFNRLSDNALFAEENGNVCQISTDLLKGKIWKLHPVFGTEYKYLINPDNGKAVVAEQGSENIVLTALPTTQQVNAMGKAVTLRSGEIDMRTEVSQATSFIDKLRTLKSENVEEFFKGVRATSGESKISNGPGGGLVVKLTENTTAMVSPYGYVKVKIGAGDLELRVKLDNAPKTELPDLIESLSLFETSSFGGCPYKGITTPRDMLTGNPDCYAARTWEKIWALKDKEKPLIKSNAVQVKLKNGVTASLTVSAKCRARQTFSGSVWSGTKSSQRPYTRFSWMPVDSLSVGSDGKLIFNANLVSFNRKIIRPYLIFDPGKTGDDGKEGICSFTLSENREGIAPYGGFENKSLDPRFNFAFNDSAGTKLEVTGAATIRIVQPNGAVAEMAIGSGNVGDAIATMMQGDSSSREYGTDGKIIWYLVTAEEGKLKSGTAVSASDILANMSATSKKQSMSWDATVDGKQQPVTAFFSSTGELFGPYGFVAGAGGSSAAMFRQGSVAHKIEIARGKVTSELKEMPKDNSYGLELEQDASKYGPYNAVVYLENDGDYTPVKVKDKEAGIVLDPTFTTLPTSLDLRGAMTVGDKLLIQTAMAFAGHIDENGGIALASNGNVVCHGLELSACRFSFRHMPNGS
ncbi:MAG: RICIN domain-containing protein, partial [Planctomycetes bacterium]|nr:RICIN domain-containing protein [Planctomycetota bacterium]